MGTPSMAEVCLTVFKIMLQRFNEVERINFDVNEDI